MTSNTFSLAFIVLLIRSSSGVLTFKENQRLKIQRNFISSASSQQLFKDLLKESLPKDEQTLRESPQLVDFKGDAGIRLFSMDNTESVFSKMEMFVNEQLGRKEGEQLGRAPSSLLRKKWPA